jgi:dihydroorotate dehydrogenase (NAD+) catalytic subunit
MGGVSSAQDCLEFLAAGASAVGVGTALFRDPALPATILADLAALLASRGVARVGDVVGMAHVGSAKPRLEVDATR